MTNYMGIQNLDLRFKASAPLNSSQFSPDFYQPEAPTRGLELGGVVGGSLRLAADLDRDGAAAAGLRTNFLMLQPVWCSRRLTARAGNTMARQPSIDTRAQQGL